MKNYRLAYFQKIIFQLLRAVNFIDVKGFVFGDLKPMNVLIDEKRNVKICNVGRYVSLETFSALCWTSITKFMLFSAVAIKHIHQCVTTQPYRPAEVALHNVHIYTKQIGKFLLFAVNGTLVLFSDVWSCGTIMAELFSGRSLFSEENNDDLFRRQCAVLGNPSAEELAEIIPAGSTLPQLEGVVPRLDEVRYTSQLGYFH